MRTSPLSLLAVVALLILAGCAGLQPDSESPPSPDEFPNASDIDRSVFDTHATEMGNTSFTLFTMINRTDLPFYPSRDDVTYLNDSNRYLAEPGDSQYLTHTTEYTSGGNGARGTGSTYSNGSVRYQNFGDNRPTVQKQAPPPSIYNESSEPYLWSGFFDSPYGSGHDYAAIDATYEREGVETFQGVAVMRYEATGVDALPDQWPGANTIAPFENFSATLLLDEDGVIRHYEYTFVAPPKWTWVWFSRSYTLSDVGSTDVEKPDWTANATVKS